MSILVYDREHNFKKWYIYWIPKAKTLGVKDDKDVVYEKTCTLQERAELLKVGKSLVEEKWCSLFSGSGLHIEEVCEKELVLSFALRRNITLERTLLSGKFDQCLYMEYTRLKTLANDSPLKRKRTVSAVEHVLKPENIKPLVGLKGNPVKKRITCTTTKASGPEFDDE